MALDDRSRSRKTYSYFRSKPVDPAVTTLSGGLGIAITGDRNQIVITSEGPAPIFVSSISSGRATTSTALPESKETIGAIYFDPTINAAAAGVATYNLRAIMLTSEVPVTASIDLYDADGIVAWPPAEVAGSTLITTNQASTFLEVDLTSVLSTVTGSGILEARIWKEPSGSVTSSITCYSANLEIEFS